MHTKKEMMAEIEKLKWDIEAYRGALGYPVPGYHTGNLSDGTTPQCGICNSQYTRAAKAFYDKSIKELLTNNLCRSK